MIQTHFKIGADALPPSRIHQLDGLRGVLAFYVAIYHLSGPFIGKDAALSILGPLIHQAWYSVDVFFVMSGFVMAYVYGQKLTGHTSWVSLKYFFMARVARLYPVHIFAMMVMAVGILPFVWNKPEFTTPDGRFSWSAAIASFFMLHAPWIDHRTWNYPAWSISAEWHAYLLFPIVAGFLLRLNLWRSTLFMVLGVSIPFCVYVFGHNADQYPTNGLLVLARVLPLFVTGVVLFNCRDVRLFKSDTTAQLVVAGSMGLLFWPGFAPGAVLLVPALVLVVLENDKMQAIFSQRHVIWLGKISYSLYMTHSLVEMYFVNKAVKWSQRYFDVDISANLALSIVVLALAILLSLVLGWLTWRWVEVPGRAWILRHTSRP